MVNTWWKKPTCGEYTNYGHFGLRPEIGTFRFLYPNLIARETRTDHLSGTEKTLDLSMMPISNLQESKIVHLHVNR
jgi:hypothetical protein